MKLAEARRLAGRLKQAEADFDGAWRKQRNAGLTLAAIFGLIPALLLARMAAGSTASGEESFVTPLAAFVGLALWLALVWAGQAWAHRRIKAKHGVGSMDAAVLARCGELDDLPQAIAEPLEQALDAYRAMSRAADDPVWKQSGFDARGAANRAADHFLSLCFWAQQLGHAADSVARLSSTAGGPDLRAAFDRQVGEFRAAAAAFQAADVRMTHAHLALAGAQGRGAATEQTLRELNATFDALAEVSHGPFGIPAAPAEPAIQQVGR